jgi:hypothetical protein
MSFNWSGYLIIAEKSYEDASGEANNIIAEAHCRSAVSRAYYCVFNVSYAKFAAVWRVNAATGSAKHEWTIVKYKNYHSSDLMKQTEYRKKGKDLERLRTYRNNADYDDVLSQRPIRRAEIAIETSRRILDYITQNP